MTKLFDNNQALTIKRRRAIQIAVFACVCAVLLTATVLFAVYYKSLSRRLTQILSSICLATVCCYSVIFADYMIYYKKILDISNSEKSVLLGCVKTIESNTTTYRSLPLRIVEVTLQDGGERRLYLYAGNLETDTEYKFEIAQNIICSYETLV